MKGGEYKEALEDYNRTLEMNPRDASIHNNLAWIYAIAKDEKFQDKGKALEHAKKAAELSHQKNAEILDTLSKAHYINEKILEAFFCYSGDAFFIGKGVRMNYNLPW